MGFLFILIGMNPLIVFLYHREWLLDKTIFKILLLVNLILFIVGYALQNNSINNFKLVVALKMPILSQLLFVILVFVFRKIFNRDPVDTFWTMDVKLMKDGIFNFIFWVLGGLLPAILVFKNII